MSETSVSRAAHQKGQPAGRRHAHNSLGPRLTASSTVKPSVKADRATITVQRRHTACVRCTNSKKKLPRPRRLALAIQRARPIRVASSIVKPHPRRPPLAIQRTSLSGLRKKPEAQFRAPSAQNASANANTAFARVGGAPRHEAFFWGARYLLHIPCTPGSTARAAERRSNLAPPAILELRPDPALRRLRPFHFCSAPHSTLNAGRAIAL